MNSVNEAVLELAQQHPEECTWDEVMYRIFVRQRIDAGLQDADAGRTIPHEEVKDGVAVISSPQVIQKLEKRTAEEPRGKTSLPPL